MAALYVLYILENIMSQIRVVEIMATLTRRKWNYGYFNENRAHVMHIVVSQWMWIDCLEQP